MTLPTRALTLPRTPADLLPLPQGSAGSIFYDAAARKDVQVMKAVAFLGSLTGMSIAVKVTRPLGGAVPPSHRVSVKLSAALSTRRRSMSRYSSPARVTPLPQREMSG
jgi:hypothetical protein